MIVATEKWKLAWVVSAVALVIGILLYFIFVPRSVQVESVVASTGSFQEFIQADAILRSKERYTVPAFADGDIKRVSLRVGDSVRKGQAITELYWDVNYEPVRAPISGVISKVHRESAGPIRRGEPIVEIIDPLRLEVMAELLTTDAVRLKQGARVTVKNWTGGAPILGKVSRISKAGFTKQSALGVEEERTEVTANLIDVPKDFISRAGSTFHVDVTFQVSERAYALKIPIGALFRDGQNWAVYVVEGDRARKRVVVISGTNMVEASVQSGIKAGDRVIVYPGDLVSAGTRVSVD